MNGKASFLKFFFDSGKFSDSTLTGHIVDLFPAIVYVYDADSGRIRYVNKRFHEFFGSTPNHIADALQVVHPEDIATVEAALTNLHSLEENDSHTYMNRVHMGDGVWKTFRTQAYVLQKRPDGKASAILFISKDVSEEMRHQQETDAFHEILDDTEDLLQFGSWTIDAGTRTMTWSNGMVRLLGYSSHDVAEVFPLNTYLQHVTPEYRERISKIVDHCLGHNENFEAEYVVRAKSGIHKIVFTKAKYIAEGEGGRLIGITRDITALRNFETEQARNIRELNRSNRELEEFAYVASHDLQEPIRKISMFCDRLKGKLAGTVDPEAEIFLERIKVASSGMRELVDNLLEYSRANRGSHSFTSVDLGKVFSHVLSDLELKISESKSTVNVIGAWPIIDGVETEIRQVFTNLLGNAIKFRKQGQPAVVRIQCSSITANEKRKHNLDSGQSYFRMDFIDNGIGFETHDAYKIFEIFQRLHSKTAYPGSGIGLSICKKIVENHKGIIFANSSPGHGSTFTVILPENHF